MNNSFETFKPDDTFKLEETEISRSREIMYLHKNITLDSDSIKKNFKIFSLSVVENTYQSRAKAVNHFYNWLKKQDLSKNEKLESNADKERIKAELYQKRQRELYGSES